jgi:hypothetical protein
MAQDVLDNPEASVTPLLSMNKTAAVLFARAAGEKLVAINMHRIGKLSDDDNGHRE